MCILLGRMVTTCHGAAAGKNGFRLTLRGYDPELDYLILTRQASARRINRVEPANSLMLLKPTMAVSHGGGKRFGVESPEYQTIAQWIASGAPAPAEWDPGLTRLEAKALQGRGLAAERSGNLEVAIEHYEAAEQMLDAESPIARADVVAAKARCLQMMGDTRYAAYALESLLEMLERRNLKDPTALVRLHASLVAAYFELGLYKKASGSADQALALASRVDDPEGLAAPAGRRPRPPAPGRPRRAAG